MGPWFSDLSVPGRGLVTGSLNAPRWFQGRQGRGHWGTATVNKVMFENKAVSTSLRVPGTRGGNSLLMTDPRRGGSTVRQRPWPGLSWRLTCRDSGTDSVLQGCPRVCSLLFQPWSLRFSDTKEPSDETPRSDCCIHFKATWPYYTWTSGEAGGIDKMAAQDSRRPFSCLIYL